MPSPGADEGDEHPPQAADTFFIVLDPHGVVVSNPSNVPARGPAGHGRRRGGRRDAAATCAPSRWRPDPVRLETLPIGDLPTPNGWLQAGYVLLLHDAQSRSLVVAIAIVGIVGLFGAALVTLWITGRALVPIRRAFATERRFVADASHEIRTPAAIIRASAEVLQREDLVRPDGRAARRRHRGRGRPPGPSRRGAARPGRVGAGLAGRRATARSTCGTSPSPPSGERSPSPSSTASRSSGRPRQGPALPLLGDPDRLLQLLLVLLDNAFRFSPPGGSVTVDVDRAGRRVRVLVSDDGPGVPEEERERIFEPFASLPDARGARRGSGLGLPIARRIAELHGGTLTVEGAATGGARFVLAIPAH